MAVPPRIHPARSKIANISLILRVGFYSQVFGLNEASSNLAVRQGYLIETSVAVAAISALHQQHTVQ